MDKILADKHSKFDVNIVLTSEVEKHCEIYGRVFKGLKKVKVEKVNYMDTRPADAYILPVPSSFGIFSNKSAVLGAILRSLGLEFIATVQDYILRKYLGEQPVGSAFILKCPSPQYKFIVVVAMFRILTCKGDEMSWLDPGYVPPDYAYSTIRGALLALLRHNATTKASISTVICPDLFSIRKEAPGGELLTEGELDLVAQQMLLATESIFNPTKQTKTIAEGILLQRQILDKDKKHGVLRREDLLQMLHMGTLEARGLYTMEEVEQVVNWARGNDPKLRLLAAKLLASSLNRAETNFNVPRNEVAIRITDKNTGCLAYLLDLVAQNEITLHQEIPFEELHLDEVVGEGTAGTVYRGLWKEQRVAIKHFRNDIKHSEFIRELSLMSVVRHKNLVYCYGGVTIGGRMMIVQELMQANLADVLATQDIEISMGLVIQVALEVAQGVLFLHNHCNLIHRDLKSMNLLVNTIEGPDLVVKVCDFGVSRVIDKKKVMTGNIGTISWIAPEVFQQRKYSEKADIYSFGIILWELVTRQIPFANLSSFGIPVSVIKGERPQLPKNLPSAYKRLVRQCWAGPQKKRPSLNKVIESLLKLYTNLPVKDKLQRNFDIGPVLSKPKIVRSTTNRMLWTRRNGREGTLSHIQPNISKGEKSRREIEPMYEEPPNEMENNDNDNDNSNEDEYSEDDNEKPTLNPPQMTVTCHIPAKWAQPIADIELKINRHFSQLGQDFDNGTIYVGQQRYILMRGESFASDFLRTIRAGFGLSENKAECLDISQKFLYELGIEIGKVDSSSFLKYISNNSDPISDINSLFVNIAYTGIAYVALSPESEIESLNSIFLKSEFIRSFEADIWEKRKGRGRVCVLGSGYISGWVENVTDLPFAVGETSCKKNKDATCLCYGGSHKKLEEKLNGNIPDLVKKMSPSIPNQTWLETSLREAIRRDVNFPAPVFSIVDARKFTEPTSPKTDMEDKVSELFGTFFIDPTFAEVELADERCLLLQNDGIGLGFYRLLNRLLKGHESRTNLFYAKFMYSFGKAMGITDSKWFFKLLEGNYNPIQKLAALPLNLSYFGWCDLKFTEGFSTNEILEKKEKFKILCTANTTFESDSWLHSEFQFTGPCICFLLSGYISGWVELSFGFPVVCVEQCCRFSKSHYCEFVIAHPSFSGFTIPENLKDTPSIKIHSYALFQSIFLTVPDFQAATKAIGGEKSIGKIRGRANRSRSIDVTGNRIQPETPSPRRKNSASPISSPITTAISEERPRRRNSFDSPRYQISEGKRMSEGEGKSKTPKLTRKRKVLTKTKSQKLGTISLKVEEHKRNNSELGSEIELSKGTLEDVPLDFFDDLDKRRSKKKKPPTIKKRNKTGDKKVSPVLERAYMVPSDSGKNLRKVERSPTDPVSPQRSVLSISAERIIDEEINMGKMKRKISKRLKTSQLVEMLKEDKKT